MNHNNVQIKEPPYQYHIGAIVIFLVWLELMMIIGRFPMFGLYVQMFTTGKRQDSEIKVYRMLQINL